MTIDRLLTLLRLSNQLDVITSRNVEYKIIDAYFKLNLIHSNRPINNILKQTLGNIASNSYNLDLGIII